MIARLKGRIIEKNPTSLVIDVHGVGYLVSVSLTTSSALDGTEAELFIQTEVKEDAIQLFGFLKREERELFCLLRDVQGIGPQTALAILSNMSTEEFSRALREQNPQRFLGIPRVGKKTAERILLELKEKKISFAGSSLETGQSAEKTNILKDALSALESLGYKTPEAVKALDEAEKELPPESGVENLIRRALKKLSP